MIRSLRTWESDDPQYRWSITVGGPRAAGRLKVHTDPIPTADGARAFARALLEAADYQQSGAEGASIRIAVDSPARPVSDWSSIATDIASALGAPDEAVEVTSVVKSGSEYHVQASISAPPNPPSWYSPTSEEPSPAARGTQPEETHDDDRDDHRRA